MSPEQPVLFTYAEKEVELPAGYLCPEDGKLYRSVVVREMSGEEEDLLFNEKNARAGNSLNKVLAKLCKLKDLPSQHFVDDLLIVDQYYLLVQARILTYGNIYTFQAKHPEADGGCGETTTVRLELDSLKFESPTTPTALEETVSLPKSGLIVTFKKNQGKDQANLRKIAYGGADDKISQLIQYRARKIVKDGKELPLTVLKQLPLSDRKILREAMSQSEGKAETSVDVPCGGCGQTLKVEMPLNQDFFCLGGRES
jgi:hypothetical protein